MKRYRIKSIVLRNITSHVDTRLDLPSQGSIALIGPNGAGKSSIVEAVYTALTLSSLRGEGRGGLYELVRRNQAIGEIQVLLEAPGDKVTAYVRLYSGRKKKEARLRVNGRLVANSDKAYRIEVARLLGVSNHDKLDKLLESSVIIPQGSLREIANKMSKPREFRELVENAIGIPDYRKALEKLPGLYIEYEGEGERIPRVSSKDPKRALQSLSRSLDKKLKKQLENREEAKQKITLYTEEKERVEKELGKVAASIETLEEKQEALREKLRRLTGEIERLRQIEDQIQDKEKRLRDIRKRLEEAREAIRKLPRIRELASLQGNLARLRMLREDLLNLRVKLREYEALVEALRTYNEALEDAKRYDEIQAKIQSLEREIAKITAKIEARERELKRVRDLARKGEFLLAELARITGTSIRRLEDARRLLDKLQSEAAKAREELNKVEVNLATIKSRKDEAEKALDTLRKSTEARCPVCGSPLTEERKKNLEIELKERIRELERIEDKLSGKLAEIRKKTNRIENVIQKTVRIYSRAEAILSQVEASDISKLEDEIRRLRETLSRLNRELEKLRSEAATLESAKKRFEAAKALLESRKIEPGDYEKILGEYESLRGRVRELDGEANRVEDFILTATSSVSLREAEEKIIEAVRSLGRLEETARQKPLLEEEARDLENNIVRLKERVGELPVLLEEEEELEGELKKLEEELNNMREEEKRLIAEKEGKEKLIEEYSRRKREAEEAIRRLMELRKRVVTAIVAGAILADVQERLLENARAALEDTMTRFLEKFGLEYHAVEIDDTGRGFEVSVLSRSSRTGTPVRLLSGGEQTALALAYVLALQHNLALRTGFLILDEPTSELDAERREVLMNLFQEIGDDLQLLIVTHHEDVVDKVDMVCSVRKEGDSSRVECGGLG